MRAIFSSVAALSLFAMMAGGVQAEQKLTKNSIIDFMVKSADLGASRGICIGTQQECARTAEPQGLDMLITFEHASDELTETAKSNLEVFSEALKDKRLSIAKFVVEGHTDAKGSEKYNEGLAERRAQAVVGYLQSSGIEASRLIPVGMGERSPRSDDVFDPINRRVEMRVSLQ